MHEDKRHSYRYPVQEGFRSAIVKIGRQELLVQLVEESAGGFSLTCDSPFAFKAGQEALLQNSGGVYQVEIAHVTKHEETTRVGLKRLASVSQPEPPKSSGFAAIFAGGGQRQSGGVLSFMLFAAMGACLALFFSGGFDALGGGANGNSSAVSYQLTSPGGTFHRGLAGLNTLTSEDIAGKLGLSDMQRKNIQSIFQQTSQSLSAAYERSGSDSAAWEQESGQLVEQAARRVVSSLTREQLQEWSQILQQDPPAENGA